MKGVCIVAAVELRNQHPKKNVICVGVHPTCAFIEGGRQARISSHKARTICRYGLLRGCRQVFCQTAAVPQEREDGATCPRARDIGQIMANWLAKVDSLTHCQFKQGGGGEVFADRSYRKPRALVDSAPCIRGNAVKHEGLLARSNNRDGQTRHVEVFGGLRQCVSLFCGKGGVEAHLGCLYLDFILSNFCCVVFFESSL